MASLIRESVKGNVRFTIKDIKVVIEQRYSFKTPCLKYWQTKEITIAQLFGGWRQAYDLIMPLLHAIQRTNPGTLIEWFTAPINDPNEKIFQAVCWAYDPAIEAFKHCKPIIGIDDTHLSRRYKGKMLVACGFDAKDQLVPLAFALVDTENNKY
jgi:MULE transposase domain